MKSSGRKSGRFWSDLLKTEHAGAGSRGPGNGTGAIRFGDHDLDAGTGAVGTRAVEAGFGAGGIGIGAGGGRIGAGGGEIGAGGSGIGAGGGGIGAGGGGIGDGGDGIGAVGRVIGAGGDGIGACGGGIGVRGGEIRSGGGGIGAGDKNLDFLHIREERNSENRQFSSFSWRAGSGVFGAGSWNTSTTSWLILMIQLKHFYTDIQ
ncbi:Protein CBG16993 [Caenorhabditis briggsae]|uniref:Protein CBG16993 n=1 Tax=Caenorhabditis briggsae TaxID=6238 RepID=A8XQ78_CAEBR|nr:Protein CBG16993 [Caenorhabditis briggsae]CAP34804.1 Protein CBG16993 [Caenorhabditis briggsae]